MMKSDDLIYERRVYDDHDQTIVKRSPATWSQKISEIRLRKVVDINN